MKHASVDKTPNIYTNKSDFLRLYGASTSAQKNFFRKMTCDIITKK